MVGGRNELAPRNHADDRQVDPDVDQGNRRGADEDRPGDHASRVAHFIPDVAHVVIAEIVVDADARRRAQAEEEAEGISAFGGNAIGYYYWRTLLFEFWRPEAARAAADSLIWAARTLVAERPNDPGVHAAKGWLFAIKGQPDSAARAARRALELAPATDDAFAWGSAAHQAAGTFVRIGDYDTAIDQLEQLLGAPSWISGPVLRTDPLWAPLRGHPRFERLLQRG